MKSLLPAKQRLPSVKEEFATCEFRVINWRKGIVNSSEEAKLSGERFMILDERDTILTLTVHQNT